MKYYGVYQDDNQYLKIKSDLTSAIAEKGNEEAYNFLKKNFPNIKKRRILSLEKKENWKKSKAKKSLEKAAQYNFSLVKEIMYAKDFVKSVEEDSKKSSKEKLPKLIIKSLTVMLIQKMRKE